MLYSLTFSALFISLSNIVVMHGVWSLELLGFVFVGSSVTTVGKSTNIVWQECMVRKEEKQKLLGQKGCVIWITGLSGSGSPPPELWYKEMHFYSSYGPIHLNALQLWPHLS
jgi:hypothetical protein